MKLRIIKFFMIPPREIFREISPGRDIFSDLLEKLRKGQSLPVDKPGPL